MERSMIKFSNIPIKNTTNEKAIIEDTTNENIIMEKTIIEDTIVEQSAPHAKGININDIYSTNV